MSLLVPQEWLLQDQVSQADVKVCGRRRTPTGGTRLPRALDFTEKLG